MAGFWDIANKYGTDKVVHHGYHFIYPRFLETLRADAFVMLEIGYAHGVSARMWEEYFPHAKIFVADIGVSGTFGRHEVLQADQSNPDDLRRVVERVGSARLVVDDGSHQPNHQYETFDFLFRHLLEPGGVYIIEDVETSYWHPDSTIYGYRIGPFDAIDATTKLIDLVNAEFSGRANDIGVSSVTYAQNCIVITKQTSEERARFARAYRFQDRIDSPVSGSEAEDRRHLLRTQKARRWLGRKWSSRRSDPPR